MHVRPLVKARSSAALRAKFGSLLLGIGGILIPGCAPTVVARHTLLALPAETPPDTVRTHVPGGDLPGPCTMLGSVYAYRHADDRFQNPSMERVHEDLMVQAKEMGADRIAFLITGKDDPRTGGGFTKWGRGIACDCATPHAAEARRCPTCIVAMPRIRPAEGASDTTLTDDHDRRIRELVQFELSSRGYYLVPTLAECGKSAARLEAVPDVVLSEQLATVAPTTIMDVEIVDDSGFNLGLVADRSYTLKATLRDAATGSTIWMNEAAGKAGGFGLLYAAPSGSAAKQQAIQALFLTLPDLTEGTH